MLFARLGLPLVLLTVAACQTISPGTGDLALSEPVSRKLDRYFTLSNNPIAFAVTADGEYGTGLQCPAVSNCSGNWRTELQRFCERGSDGRPCYILAERKEIVWQGKVTKRSGLAFSDTDTAATFTRAERTVHRGPAEAVGVIVYLPGSAGLDQTDREQTAVPPYVRTLNGMGWDAVRGNVANSLRVFSKRAEFLTADALLKKAHALRAEGYAKVVFAGQSVGGAEALRLTQRGEGVVDAIISAVPGCCGRDTHEDGSRNERFPQNTTYYFGLVERMGAVPVILAFFREDPYEHTDRHDRTVAMLRDRGIPHYIINKPDNILGHSGAWNTAFAHVYAGCINDFLVNGGRTLGDHCTNPPRPGGDHRWMTAAAHLNEDVAERVRGADLTQLFAGKTLTGTNKYGFPLTAQFEHTVALVGQGGPADIALETSRRNFWANDELLCISDFDCRAVYRGRDGTILFVRDGEISFRGRFVEDQSAQVTP